MIQALKLVLFPCLENISLHGKCLVQDLALQRKELTRCGTCLRVGNEGFADGKIKDQRR